MTEKKLSRIGELSLLDKIRRDFPTRSGKILVGIGDDAAVIRPEPGNLLLTTDMMVAEVHFDLSFTTPYQLGFKLVSVNVSDIYAMGGTPSYILLNMALPEDTNMKFVEMFFLGIKEAMSFYKIKLIGGDISSAHKSMSLSATLVGYASKPVRRSGAKAGDRIYVTGNLGDSACGLELLRKIKKPVPIQNKTKNKAQGAQSNDHMRYVPLKGLLWTAVEPLLRRHLMPVARNPKGFAHKATSMIDISDGLLLDLTRLCNESNVGARVYIENIPLSNELKKAASHIGIPPVRMALSGGEDYELLFTAQAGKKVKGIYIGEITKSERVLVDKAGREKPFTAEGYQHFRGSK